MRISSPGKFPRTDRKSRSQTIGDGAAEDEAAALDAHDDINSLIVERLGKRLDRRAKTVFLLQQRRDVEEINAGLREIRDAADF